MTVARLHVASKHITMFHYCTLHSLILVAIIIDNINILCDMGMCHVKYLHFVLRSFKENISDCYNEPLGFLFKIVYNKTVNYYIK